ncbi:MAG: TetR/AcrR family transcriptional regulator [Janthinobacterium lividum]
MPRLSKEQIDEEILEAAAALFARHGFEQTSIQRIADAVGYSKTGLLHRFPTKEALQEATVARTAEQLATIVTVVEGLPLGASRDLEVVERLATTAQARPGLVAFMLSVLSADTPSALGKGVDDIGEVLFRAFGSPAADDVERAVRITTALGGLAVTSLACRDVPPGQIRPHLIAAAFDALGHGNPAIHPTPAMVTPRGTEEN